MKWYVSAYYHNNLKLWIPQKAHTEFSGIDKEFQRYSSACSGINFGDWSIIRPLRIGDRFKTAINDPVQTILAEHGENFVYGYLDKYGFSRLTAATKISLQARVNEGKIMILS